MSCKRLALIIPYFGKFNSYFQLFLKTCKYNPRTDWIIFTDDKTNFNYPENVHVYYMTFKNMQKLIQSKFDFEVSINKPYKLCDYKVAYGYIFYEYIKEYEYWGYCDTDIVWGDLDSFLDEKLKMSFDKLFPLGHLSIYKNSEKLRTLFRGTYIYNGIYKDIFSQDKIWGFDELYINSMVENSGLQLYEEDVSANPSVYYYKFRLVKKCQALNRYLTEDYVDAKYYWENGKLYRVFFNDDTGKMEKNKFPYIHLQQRKMKMDKNILNGRKIEIGFGEFWPETVKWKKINFDVLKKCAGNRLRWKIKKSINLILPGMYNRAKL